MQYSLTPSTACLRFTPSSAAQPVPGTRLLQAAQLGSRKYWQRVRCSMLPARLAICRSCELAAMDMVWAITG